MSYDVFYTAKARDDLEEIYEYIAFNLQEPVTAGKLYQNIITAVHTLKNFPLRNALYENEPWRSRGLRKLPVKNFLVFYTVNEETPPKRSRKTSEHREFVVFQRERDSKNPRNI